MSIQQHQKVRQCSRPQPMMARDKYVSHHVICHIIFVNLKGYGCQGLDPRKKVCHLLNEISYENISNAIATVKVHPERYEKDFDKVVAYFLNI